MLPCEHLGNSITQNVCLYQWKGERKMTVGKYLNERWYMIDRITTLQAVEKVFGCKAYLMNLHQKSEIL